MGRWWIAPLLSLTLAIPARADDPVPPRPAPPAPPGVPAPRAQKPLTPEQAADAVVAARKAKDDAPLGVAAARDHPDPWLIADELIRRGEIEAAFDFATAASRPAIERLPAYVDARRGVPDDEVRRARFVGSMAALSSGTPQGALDALGEPDPATPSDVVGVSLLRIRATALTRLMRLDEADAMNRRAADGAQSLGWHACAARAVVSIGITAGMRAEWTASIAAFERGLKTLDQIGDRWDAADVLTNLGVSRQELGDYAAALASHERALREYEALGDHAGMSVALSNIGNVHTTLGNYPKALALSERARREQLDLGMRWEAARTLKHLGSIHEHLGNFSRAFEIDNRALQEMESLGLPGDVAGVLAQLGALRLAVGDYPGALETLARALDRMEALGARGGAAGALGNIAVAHARLHDYGRALEVLDRTRKAFEALGERAGTARTMDNTGVVYEEQGNHTRAQECYEQALQQYETLGLRVEAAGVREKLGILHVRTGDLAKGLPLLERAAREGERLRVPELQVYSLWSLAAARLLALDAGRAAESAHQAVKLLETMLGGLAEEQGAVARAQFAGLFAVGAQAAARAVDPPDVAFFLESGRAGTLLEALGGRQSMRWANLPDDLRVAKAEAQAKEALAVREYQKVLDLSDLATVREKSKAVDRAQNRVREVVDRIQREAKKQAAVWYPRAATMEEIQGWLVEGDALVLYGVLGEDALALVLTRTEARIVSLGKSAAIAEACQAHSVGDPRADSAAGLARLRDLVVKPLGIEKAKRLLLSPEGPLSYVPFSALVPDLPLVTVPSGTTYGLLLEDAKKRGDLVLAAGDPDYAAARNETAVGVYARGGRLLQLPGTRAEAKAVGDVLLLGKDASEAGLREALSRKPRWRSVHLACHGLVDVERPTLCALALTPDPANDGYLTALEVLDLDVPADLVVLSACETGKGKIVNGEGIVGLTRAFMYAGSPRVICSLWKVDDDATRALMTKFYELWNPKDGKAGLPTAQALRTAQEFIRTQDKWKHPYYWAAWVLWGLPD